MTTIAASCWCPCWFSTALQNVDCQIFSAHAVVMFTAGENYCRKWRNYPCFTEHPVSDFVWSTGAMGKVRKRIDKISRTHEFGQSDLPATIYAMVV